MFQQSDVAAIPFRSARPSVDGDLISMPVPRRKGRTRFRLRRSDIKERGLPGFLRWLQRDFPAAHAGLSKQRPDLLAPAGDIGFRRSVPMPSMVDGLGFSRTVAYTPAPTAVNRGQQISDFLMPLLQVYQQRQILKLQLKRAQLGQPPLDVESLGAPATRIELEAGAKTQRTALWVAGAVVLTGAALFLGRRRPAR